MAEFIYYEKSKPTEKTKGAARSRKKSFAPARRAKVEDDIEHEVALPFKRKGAPSEEEEANERKEEVERTEEEQGGESEDVNAKRAGEVDKKKKAAIVKGAKSTTTTTTKAHTNEKDKKEGQNVEDLHSQPAPSTTVATAPASSRPAPPKRKVIVKKKVPSAPLDPAFIREKERFLAHFRTVVESLVAKHAPLDKSGRTQEVNAKVHEICSEFLADMERAQLPTKEISEEEYQKRMREEEEMLAETRARSVRCAKLRQRIDLLQREIARQQREKEQWEHVQTAYERKNERLKRAQEASNEEIESTAKRLKTGEIQYPDFLSNEDKMLLEQLKLTPMDIERATQALSLETDFLNGILRGLAQFDQAVDHWTKAKLADHHKRWQQETGTSSTKSLIRGITNTAATS